MAATMPSLKNISWERLVNEGAVTYPADGPNVPGNEILFSAGYPTASGRGKIVPAAVRPPDEIPDDRVSRSCCRPAACSSTGTPAR